MKEITTKVQCPNCGGLRVKALEDLSDDEKTIVERLPGSAELTPAERKKHRFCTRCWFEVIEMEDRFV